MAKAAATILVVGDPGPFRRELLLHREIEVLWAGTVDEALAMARNARLDGCIISPEFTSDGPSREHLRPLMRALVPSPVIVLVASDAGSPGFGGDHPPHVVEVGEVESLVRLLAERTGLRFARFPRADLILPASVVMAGRHFSLQTINISVCGVAVRGFPPAPVGARAHLILEVEGKALHLSCRVVRWFDHQGVRSAGLTFVDLGEAQRTVIGRAVEKELRWIPGQRLDAETLFGDLGLDDGGGARPLRTVDVGKEPFSEYVPLAGELELDDLCRLIAGEPASSDVPLWMIDLASELTEVEAVAARGAPAPEWAKDALRLRVALARTRGSSWERKVPSVLRDDAYRLFERLKTEAAGQPGAVMAQIGKIRAALLREIVSVARPRFPVTGALQGASARLAKAG